MFTEGREARASQLQVGISYPPNTRRNDELRGELQLVCVQSGEAWDENTAHLLPEEMPKRKAATQAQKQDWKTKGKVRTPSRVRAGSLLIMNAVCAEWGRDTKRQPCCAWVG
jgi:hypothetical protein